MSNTAESSQPETDAVLGPDGDPLKQEQAVADEQAPVAASEVPDLSNAAPVPRISIQAFCETAETAEAFQIASEDRRLMKAHVTVQMGGATGAAEHFRDLPTPNLIIVETSEQGESLFAQLLELSQVCDSTTKVVVIGHTNDIIMYRELIRQGISEYLVTPLSPQQIIEAISALYLDPSAPPIGRNVVFLSARGGAGASTLAHNTGWLISEKFKDDVTIVDLDLPFGTAGLDFNQDPAQGVADAITSPERVDDVLLDRLLLKHTDHLSLFTSPCTLEREFDLDPGAFESVLDIVRKSVPYVIIDLPHIWTAWSKSVLLSADEIVLVATPDLASLRNTKSYLELLKIARPNDGPAILVLNQTGVAKRPEIPEKDFAEAVGIDVSFVLPFEPQLFGTAANNGQMLSDVDNNAVCTKELERLASRLTGREVIETTKKSGFLDMFKAKARSA